MDNDKIILRKEGAVAECQAGEDPRKVAAP
jgi:hypothetical protein